MEDVVCVLHIDEGTKKNLKHLSVQMAAVCSLKWAVNLALVSEYAQSSADIHNLAKAHP
jgi:hypothetical protein